jgi:predicted nucleic acid-binding protein
MSPANPKYFVDTNILIYAHDRAAGPKHDRARQLIEHLWTTGQGVLSTQVLQELCVNLRRRIAHPLPSAEIRKLIEDYLSWEIVVNTPQAILAALEIEGRYKVSYWDALILQATESCGAAVLYSQELGQRPALWCG